MRYALSLFNYGALWGSIAVIQGLLLNRLGLAIAAVPAFVGLGAYAFASARFGFVNWLLFALLALGLAVLMAWLANRLRLDYYLLATLSILECLGGGIGLSLLLGGREGLMMESTLFDTADPEVAMFPWSMACVLFVLLWVRSLLRAPLGIAIDRMRENPATSVRWFPAKRLRSAVVAQALLLAFGIGHLLVYYQGHVSPKVFSLSTALLILAFSVISGRYPEIASGVAILYWVLPFALAHSEIASGREAAEVVRIIWGLILVGVVSAPVIARRRGPGGERI